MTAMAARHWPQHWTHQQQPTLGHASAPGQQHGHLVVGHGGPHHANGAKNGGSDSGSNSPDFQGDGSNGNGSGGNGTSAPPQ